MTKNTKLDATSNIELIQKVNDKVSNNFILSFEKIFQQIIKGDMPTYSESEMNLIIDKL